MNRRFTAAGAWRRPVADEPVRAVIAYAEDFEVVGVEVPSG